ncbi:glycoside hydrolase family 140 protein [Mucilaginibacter sp. HMF5004]|uniref:glycoside hydrolase family 140 protein n=1 Tax=Mucilaginibacter rivuli TaxID=2857527 RepID=UPI001C5D9968|nr:glycoside hydrolase family 140 protein [Mucilaginibacter rivuli]MBW4889023.1 glycoside hydrolase family 140 protein [Mucilaginibacter rivuli]
MYKKISIIVILALVFAAGNNFAQSPLKISANHRYFTTADGKPFFWLGDTGWLLFSKLNREDAEKYLEDRRKKGFNVIQVMVLHTVGVVNAYGDTALIGKNVATPKVTPGNSPKDPQQYDYWDHVDFIVDLAAKKGIYIAMVPVWGSNVKERHVNQAQGRAYAGFLAKRYKDKPNVIWMNGGDVPGSDSIKVWRAIGSTLHHYDTKHLITYHPRGRTQSSNWFHNDTWLDFNCFQSGHRDYAQDTSKKDFQYGEDNWKYVNVDYKKLPIKPTLDAEPSYEAIPHGLHDTTLAHWTAADVRRYGYWSVFAGGCGYTYGDNSVMQMYKPGEKGGSYGAKMPWFDAINDPGAAQMQYIKKLMLSRPYFGRVPDQSLIVGAKQGKRYNYLIGTKGTNYAFIYTYNGRDIPVNLGKIQGAKVKASWYDPRTGETQLIGTFPNKGTKTFKPAGEVMDGNDWVLILDKA